MTERHVSPASISDIEKDKAWASQALFEELGKLFRTKHHAGALLLAFICNVRGISRWRINGKADPL